MNATLFDELDATLGRDGGAAAIDRLCSHLRDTGAYNALFYALLMKKRNELGVSPIPTGPADELPAAVHEAYEDAIRTAARTAGELYLKANQLPQAWAYFRMIGEPAPMKAALEAATPVEDEDIQPLVQIAFYEGVHPTRGFDWILERYGLCNAITTMGGGEAPLPHEIKQYCIRALVRTLYSELRARLTAEITAHDGTAPPEASAAEGTPGVLRALTTGRDWLFPEDAYHIDTSHLSSVVQMSLLLDPCPEQGMARELCGYGARLSGMFAGQPEPPFEDGYRDYDIYLSVLTGDNVDGGLAHFRDRLATYDPEEIGSYPAEVFVNLLLRIGRGEEAIAVSRQYLVDAERQGRQLTCPNLNELCQRFKAYNTLADAARQLNDPVYYLAGKLAAARNE